MDVYASSTRLQQFVDGYCDYATDRACESARELAEKMKEQIKHDAGLSAMMDQRFVSKAFGQEIMAMYIADQFKKAFMEEFNDSNR